MTYFSRSKIKQHRFRVDNKIGELGIGYGMIIGRDMMVQLGLPDDFKLQVMQWDGVTIPMKEPSSLLWKSDITSREMGKVIMQTAEPVSTNRRY